jgi:hypothetical protein
MFQPPAVRIASGVTSPEVQVTRRVPEAEVRRTAHFFCSPVGTGGAAGARLNGGRSRPLLSQIERYNFFRPLPLPGYLQPLSPSIFCKFFLSCLNLLVAGYWLNFFKFHPFSLVIIVPCKFQTCIF